MYVTSTLSISTFLHRLLNPSCIQTILRCERQYFHRLPSSKAIVFAFHTYRYPIQDIKDEGSGEDLAQAIDGLENGSIREMFIYKNGDKWADAVRDFLRS
jgi:hypothetical protein